MPKNQFGRRNLSVYQRAELSLKLEPLLKAKGKENLSAGGGDKKSEAYKSGSPNSAKAISPIDRREELAQAAGVSHDTIGKVRKITEQAIEPIKEMARKGELSVNAAARGSVSNGGLRMTPEKGGLLKKEDSTEWWRQQKGIAILFFQKGLLGHR
jgi:hypothetical protein